MRLGKIQQFFECLGDVRGLCAALRVPGVFQQVFHDVAAVLDDLFDRGQPLADQILVVFLKLFLYHLRIEQRVGKRGVEFVRQSCGKKPERRQFVLLRDLKFELLLPPIFRFQLVDQKGGNEIGQAEDGQNRRCQVEKYDFSKLKKFREHFLPVLLGNDIPVEVIDSFVGVQNPYPPVVDRLVDPCDRIPGSLQRRRDLVLEDFHTEARRGDEITVSVDQVDLSRFFDHSLYCVGDVSEIDEAEKGSHSMPIMAVHRRG